MPKTIVVLGAGFAGLHVARALKHSGYEIIIIDQYNFHQFQPLLYQVATGRIEPSAVSFPLRKIFQRRNNVHVRITQVISIDTTGKLVHTNDGDFKYDFLVIATGCTTNFFGNKEIELNAHTMKSTPEAIALRNHILLNFEDALSAAEEEIPGIMNIVIAGGGPTGVELAGSIAELKTNILPKDYPDMDFSGMNIYLVEGLAHTLQNMSEAAQVKSQEYLERMGVQLWLNTLVQGYDGKVVTMKDGRKIPTRTLIWTAGVTGNLPKGLPTESLAKGNRIRTDQYHAVVGIKDVYAIGDVSYMETADWPKGHPQLANVANNQGKHLAHNFQRMLRNEQLLPFNYKNPGTMATVGKRKAVVDLPFFRFQGVIAWLTWMFLHLMLILSVKNKLFIFINWMISYFTNDTTLRLILLPTRKQAELGKAHHSMQNSVVTIPPGVTSIH